MSANENTTKPTIETVLERINSLGEKPGSRIGGLENRMVSMEDRMIGLENRMSALEGEVGEIRNDLRTGLRMVERK